MFVGVREVSHGPPAVSSFRSLSAIESRRHVQYAAAGRGVGLKILYRNPRRPGYAGMKPVPDQSQRAAEKEILEGLGFTVIGMTPVPFGLKGAKT
jgi:hypothetical protein